MTAMSRKLICSLSVLFALSLSVVARAENRFHVEEGTLRACDTGQSIQLLCDNDIVLLGLSFGIRYETDKISITEVSNVGTVGETAEFFDGRILADEGLLGYGCVFGFETVATDVLDPGTDQVVGVLSIDVWPRKTPPRP